METFVWFRKENLTNRAGTANVFLHTSEWERKD